ncbi:MAG TPA: M20/M25/M40 family metallo-hydrolase [Allosphingosinicella sp.]|nr:M20/M25/M40 family metallo-hydrolase [Allosphingosinicella sp.]
MKRWAILSGFLLLLVAAFGFKGGLVAPPEVPASTAPGTFDTARAKARLARILGEQTSHPIDSAEDDVVRARLIAELRAIGLAPRLTDGTACNGRADTRGISCARVRNVFAALGPPTGKAVLLVSHYDSTPVGPGAADDGIGVAAMLETAALLKGRRLKRPVILLFNEGEEAGLLGARAFAEHGPFAAQVDTIVNLEARGVTGPAIMFETSRPNESVIAAYGRSAARPSANSMTADFYRMIPNDTDVSVLREQPYTILNFAVIGNETRYHTPGDRLESLDPSSLWHMGEQALAATMELANRPPEGLGGERLYTDILGRGFLSVPKTLGLALLAVLPLLFAWLAWSRRGGVWRATGACAVALLDAFLGQWLVNLAREGEWWRAFPEITSLAVAIGALAAGIASLVVLGRPLARDRLRIGFWLLFLVLGAVLSFVAPGGAIFFLLPPLIVAPAMLAHRFERPAALLAWAVLFLTWAPLLHLSETLLDMDHAWVFGPVAALVLLPALIELKPLLVRVPALALVGLTAAATVAAWVVAGLAPAYSADRKQAWGIEYAWDADAKTGRWLIVHDGTPLPASLGKFEKGVEVPWSSRPRRAAPAPSLPVPPPFLTKLSESSVAGGRLVTLRLASGSADTWWLRAPASAQIKAVRLNGETRSFGKGKAEDDFILRCHGRSCEQADVQLLVGSSSPFDATMATMRRGLPAEAAPLLKARPANATPQYSPDASYAVARTRL